MYKELTIKNIKIFKDEQKLKIAPITLLYGENSSGKTTLLKTFDIIHNIFSEQQVKRGKNVSQKDGPFFRNENIQNISPKKIHYYSNQLNKKPQEISIVLDTVISNYNLKHLFKGILISKSEINSDVLAPMKVKLKIKYFPKKRISKVDLIKFETVDGKSLVSFSRIDKKYKKINEFFDKDKVGYLSPQFNKILTRPNRFNSTYNRGRPIAEEDYFVDDALYADYKFNIENNSIWEKQFLSYEEIFNDDEKIAIRHEKIKILFMILSKFHHESKKGLNISFDNFAYFLTKQLLNSKEKNLNKFYKKFNEYFERISSNSNKDKNWTSKIIKLKIRDEKKFTKLNTFTENYKIQNIHQIEFSKQYLFSSKISQSVHTNILLINNLINKKRSKTQFIRSGKLDTELFEMRFYKRSSSINTTLAREGYATPTSFDIINILSSYINGDLTNVFVRTKSQFGFDFARFKSSNPTSLLGNFMISVKAIIHNLVICHPSKTNVDWHVANERDLPDHMRKALVDMESELKKKDISRGIGNPIVNAAVTAAGVMQQNSLNKTLSMQDEKIRQKNLLKSKESIKAEHIYADGRNFQRAIINDSKFRSKLNKTLKELLNLELLVVTPKFLKDLLQDPERYKRFRNAQRSGMMYPVGMSRYSRTKFIMLRDLKFKKSFNIHGEEVGKGPTNILPFLAQIMSDNPSLTYIIQELENNWHPKYQSKLIELIATKMKESQKSNSLHNKHFILETHSELFVLQIKKLIEKGFLKTEDVSINFIERTKDGNSKVRNLPLNSEGSFTEQWPGGFFPERTKVLTS
jgi:predicted ATPase